MNIGYDQLGAGKGKKMTTNQRIWARARDQLASALSALGCPEKLADLLARQLGSPKAIDRMTSYILQAKPKSLEAIIDEMLAIQAEIKAWKEKKEAQEAQAGYNVWLWQRKQEEEHESIAD